VVDTSVVSVLVDTGGVATIARAASLEVNDDLGVDSNRGGGLEVVQDVESVSDGRGGALSPA